MPPRNVRPRGGGGGGRASSASTATDLESSGRGLDPQQQQQLQQKYDPHHNTDQPCCSILTTIAHSIVPSTQQLITASCDTNNPTSDPDGKDTDLTNGSNNTGISKLTTDIDSNGTHQDWYLLLREYIILESKRWDECGTIVSVAASNKKKKKKKKRKKGATATAVTHDASLQGSATDVFHDPTDQDDDIDEHDPGTTCMGTAQYLVETDGRPQYQDVSTASNVGSTQSQTKEGIIIGSVELDQPKLQQEERLRRINRLMHRFIHTNSHKITTDSTTNRTTDMQQLYDFIATFHDNGSETSDTTNGQRTTATRRNSTDYFASTAISRKQIEMEVQNIRCEACRIGVENILLPNLTNLTGTAIIKHPPFRQLILNNLIIPTIYDMIDQGQESERLATEYQSLMEEGIAPPEYTKHWSFQIQIKEQPVESIAALSSTTIASVVGRPQFDVSGWVLHRPILSHQHQMDVLPQPVSNESITTNHMGWTVSEFKFLIDHYVLLLGLPADEVLKSTDMSTTSASTTLSPMECATIAARVSAKVRSLTENFKNLTSQITQSFKQVELIEERQKDNPGCHTDWEVFAMLKNDIDEVSGVVMNALLNINIEITRAVHRIISYIGAGVVDDRTTTETDTTSDSWIYRNTHSDAVAETRWATTHCYSIWCIYINGCISIINEREKYEVDLFHLAEHRTTGSCIPDMMVSPAARSLYAMFVKTKLRIAVETMQVIDQQLHASTYIGGWHSCCSTNINASFVARLFTEDLFFDSFHGSSELDHNCPEFDQSFEDVLKTIREMTDTVHDQKVDVVLEKYQQQRDKLHRIVSKLISQLYTDDSAPILTSFRFELDQIQQIPLREDAKAEYRQLHSGLIKTMDLWVRYRLDYVVTGFMRQPAPVMPYELRRSMLPDTTVLFSAHTNRCRGGNEQHRALCILVGLFFVTLPEKFKEWQAHRAAQELLTSIVDEYDDNKAIPTTPKSSKKQKKKLKKTAQTDEKKDMRIDLTENSFGAITDSDDELVWEKPVLPAAIVHDVIVLNVNGKKKSPLLHDSGEDLQRIGVVANTHHPKNRLEEATEDDVESTAMYTNQKYMTIDESVISTNVDKTAPMSSTDISAVHNNGNSNETSVSSREIHVVHKAKDVVGSTAGVENLNPEKRMLSDSEKTKRMIGVFDTSIPGGFQSAEDFFTSRLNQIFDSNETVIVIL